MKTFRILFVLFALLGLVQPLAAQESPEDVGALKVGLLPVLDTLPFYIAEEEGYFAEAGVEVEGIPVASPVERDQIMQAGAIDGMLNELTTTATFNRDAVQIQIVIVARIAYEDFPVFRVLAAPSSAIETPEHLAGVPIGVSLNTVIEYTTYRQLTSAGVAPDDIEFQSVPSIPERFQLLMQGQLEAATLPDPLAQAAIEAGAKPVIDDSWYPEYSVSVLSFSVQAIEAKPEAIRRFLLAWDKAVQALNADPEAYRALFLEKVSVPESIEETYEIPPFPRAYLPTEAQWADVLDWLIDKELLDAEVPYEESINSAFLPEVENDFSDALAVFETNCAACHGAMGLDGPAGPDLAGSADIVAMSADDIAAIITDGAPGTAMPGFSDRLSEDEIARLVELVQRWAAGE
ncbi:MAG: ABC transporter substrate-binding protein [Anaerolineae bacterium]|nr:ABC transporter substrate-binding protein [Anaerolineae bacterium]